MRASGVRQSLIVVFLSVLAWNAAGLSALVVPVADRDACGAMCKRTCCKPSTCTVMRARCCCPDGQLPSASPGSPDPATPEPGYRLLATTHEGRVSGLAESRLADGPPRTLDPPPRPHLAG